MHNNSIDKTPTFVNLFNCVVRWMSLGNQLSGVRLVDEGLRARFKAAYPEVEVQPQSPPRVSSAMEVDPTTPQMRSSSPFVVVGDESKSTSSSAQFTTVRAPESVYAAEDKPMNLDVEMATT